MPNNHNDNVISRFFRTAAALWSSAAEYQIFVILAAIALLAILPLFVTKLSDTTDVIFNIIIFCALAVAGFLLFRLKGSQLAAFTFAAALLLRLCLVFVLENSTPYMTDDIRTRSFPWIRHYDTVLFHADEFFYVYQGQRYSDTTIGEFINSPEFTDHAYRAGFLVSRLFKLFGDEFVWLRLVGTFLGAFAAAIVTLAAQEFFSKETSSIISLLSALAPQTVFYSVKFLKEIWIIFAVSLMVFGITMIIRNKKLFTAILPIAAASVMFMWIRIEYGLMFIAASSIAIYFRHKSNPAGKIITVLALIFLGVVILFCQFSQLTHKAENMSDRYTLKERGQRGRPENVAIIDNIYQSHGPLRLLNIPLSLLNPPPKNLHHIYTEGNKLYEIMLLANTCQWWLPFPFLIVGAIVIITKRTEFLAFLLPYILTMSTAALLLGGLEANVLRYRDSLAPVAFIIIGAGIESLIAEEKQWKNRIIIGVYAVFVLLAVYLYTKGF
ncbi:MAG: hypothetical protein NTW93_07740 [Phycisphaerae bacterium]|nr:hypothetical protein [Phycisphaerae bacterium]